MPNLDAVKFTELLVNVTEVCHMQQQVLNVASFDIDVATIFMRMYAVKLIGQVTVFVDFLVVLSTVHFFS